MVPPHASLAPTARPGVARARGALACTATASARRGGGPQDKALYTCGCGHAFKAPVSTSVGCPRCGSRQPW